MRHPLLTVVAALALLAPLSWQAPPVHAATAPTTPSTAQARVIVKFKVDSPLLRKQVLSAADQHMSQAQTLGQRTGLALRSGAGVADRTQVMFAVGITSVELAARLAQEGDVEYAVVDQRRHRFAAPNDPLYAAGLGGSGPAVGQWYLRAPLGEVKSSLDVETAWAISTGSSAVVVAVLDSGVRFDHADLQRVGAGGNLLPGYDMIDADRNGSGTPVGTFDYAGDGNGRDDDPSDPGDWITAAEANDPNSKFYHCTSLNPNTGKYDAEDSSWHGTQVSGLIGALTNNGLGMASVGRNVRVLPVRVLGKCGGFDSDIIAGMRWAAGIGVPGVPLNTTPARVLNLSLGGDGACSAAYQQAVAEINATGAVIVASAGNSAGHAVSTPANCPGVIGVAGLRHVGSKVGFSDLGPEISLSAPAGNCINIGAGQPCLHPILTTSNGGITAPLAGSSIYTDSFNTSLGTSFSAPLVAGTVGLMLSAQPALTAAEVLAVLKVSARVFPTSGGVNGANEPPVVQCTAPQLDANGKPVDQLQCYCTTTTCGAGMLNAGAAVIASFAGLQASIVGPVNATALQTVTLSAAPSFVITGGRIVSYAWTLLDGGGIVTGFNTATGAVVTLSPSAAGRFTASVTITDDLGTTSTSSLSVDVAAAPIPIDPPPSSGGGGGGAVGAWWLLLLGLAVMLVRRNSAPQHSSV